MTAIYLQRYQNRRGSQMLCGRWEVQMKRLGSKRAGGGFRWCGATVLWVAGLGAGCATEQKPGNNIAAELEGAPEWVTGDCRSAYGDAKAVLCGVGSVGGTRNVALARSGAMGRARTEIARSLQTKLTAMLKDYTATTTGGDQYGMAAADDQKIVDVAKQMTDQSLVGTHLDKTWISKSGTFYALVSLNVDEFKDTIDKMGTLNEAIRRRVAADAEKEWASLEPTKPANP